MPPAEFLGGAGLGRFAPALAGLGFGDVETASDRELLDDDTLLTAVGLDRGEIRAFRALVACEGTSPTVVAGRAAATRRPADHRRPTSKPDAHVK